MRKVMMKWKCICLLLVMGCSCVSSFSQGREDKEDTAGERLQPSWSSSAGSMVYFFRQYVNGYPYNGLNTLGVFGIRYNFKYLGKSTAVAVGSYPGIGFAFYSGYNSNNVFFSFDLPLMLELHTGADAHPMAENNVIGFFAGAGMGLNYLSKAFYLNNPKSGFSYGPTATTGLKFNFNGRPLIIRGSYLKNFNSELPDLKAVGILWSMGGR